MTANNSLKKINYVDYSYSKQKMSRMKEKHGISIMDRHKRPDKPLYIPRALRKAETGIISDINDSINCTNSLNTSLEKKKDLKCLQSSVANKSIRESIPVVQRCDKKKLSAIDTHSVLSNEIYLDSAQIEISVKSENENKCTHIEKCDENIVKDMKTSICYVSEDMLHSDKIQICLKPNMPSIVTDKLIDKNLQQLQINMKESRQSVEVDVFSKQLSCTMHEIDSHAETQGKDSQVAEDSWETLFNDDGECLDPKLIKELADITGRMEVTFAEHDYSDYQQPESTFKEYCNVVELYGFPVEFKTHDLTSAFSMFQEASYTIKWVDDCHALAIFASQVIANQAIHLNHPVIKIRPLSEGTKESKVKARDFTYLSEAPKPRPATSAVLARRLVTGALGLKPQTSKEQRDIERNMLRDAKEKRKLKAKKRQDIWDGIVS